MKIFKTEDRKRQKIKEIPEPEENKEGDNDKSIDLITDKKHVTDWKNHITMTIKFGITEEEFIVEMGSLVTLRTPD